jgi:prepilin signal peptidase PulO-like enzyme (type II secretory pathway)
MSTLTAAITLTLIGAAIGASFGSYASVVGARGWREATRGRSHCDVCGHTLRWFELVPLVSFVILRARCSTCGAVIGWQAFAMEAVGATSGVIAGLAVTLALNP